MNDENMEVPEYLKARMSPAQRAALESASSASMKVPRVSIRGRMFRMIENGEEVRKRTDPLTAVVLGVEPTTGHMIKAWYEAGYSPNSNSPPDCASDDGITPSPWVSKKQNDSCKTCQWNKFGSKTSPNGKPTKACRDSKRIWMYDETDWGLDAKKQPIYVPPENPEDRLIYGLNVSVASLQSLAECGRHLMAMGVAWPMARTTISFADAEYPQMDFKVGGFVTENMLEYTLKKSEAAPWRMFSTLALAAPDDGARSVPAMPLPGMVASDDVPDHVRAAAGAVQDTSAPPKTGDVDEAIKNF